MGQIRITPEQMRIRANDFRNAEEEYNNVVTTMNNLINILQDEWEGQASQKFAEQFDGLKPSFESMRQLIEDIAGQLDATANAVEQLDSDIASKFN
ncbi:MAG: WXG100 family type VII secretion target [Thermoflexaceae bacterium]|nr:WXG100 family type VII secretion target [Thermoflexaceae bacterium]